jgi:hypothetical protein
MRTFRDAKLMARALRAALEQQQIEITQGQGSGGCRRAV